MSDETERLRDWERTRLAPALEWAPERRTRFSTLSDVDIERLYGPWDLDASGSSPAIGLPGDDRRGHDGRLPFGEHAGLRRAHAGDVADRVDAREHRLEGVRVHRDPAVGAQP